MKYFVAFALFFTFMTLAGCVTMHPRLIVDLSRETWLREVETDPGKWLLNADNWFLRGEPSATAILNRQDARKLHIVTAAITVKDFNNIITSGNFQLQIYGTDSVLDTNKIFIDGPADALQHISIRSDGHTLLIMEKEFTPLIKRVILRVAARNLHKITQAGCGSIEAVRILCQDLIIETTPTACGNIFVAGRRINLTHIMQTGHSNITVLGATTPALDIVSLGSGTINIAGNVGMQSIEHHGGGDINIIGAHSNCLKIKADGIGKIGLKGPVNIESIEARQAVRVYAFPLVSKNVSVTICDDAEVGLAGNAMVLNLNTFNTARFQGQYLCVRDAFVHAMDMSHVNISAVGKMFASSANSSSIYFFGPPNLISKFISNSGVIIPYWNHIGNYCFVPRPIPVKIHPDYKGEAVRGLRYSPSYRINYSR